MQDECHSYDSDQFPLHLELDFSQCSNVKIMKIRNAASVDLEIFA